MLKKLPKNYLGSNKKLTKSHALYEKAQKLIPGGVNSPVRAFRGVGGQPLFIARGRGAKIYDVDGNSYIDYVCSWGPLILGHAHPQMVSALSEALHNGTSYGAPTALEVELAQLISQAMPAIEKVRLVSSGTEATMTAIRLARAFTGRDTIIKFDGCYHGHADSLLVKSGSGIATLGLPDSPGVPADLAAKTISLPFNDVGSVEEAVARHKGEIAGLIIEPIVGNMGVVFPKEGYLEALREITAANGIVLIFDEVITGFRVGYGGAQQLYNIKPDLTCLGKIIGGGLPVGAYGGRAEIMRLVAPEGPMYQAGTLSGNPLAVTAGITTLKMLRARGVYNRLEKLAAGLCEGISRAAARAGVNIITNRVGSMFTTFFAEQPVYDYATAKTSHTDLYSRYFWHMLNVGIYLAPSQFEASFVSLAHTERDIERTIRAAAHALLRVSNDESWNVE